MPSGTSFSRGQNRVIALGYYHSKVHQGSMFSTDHESEALVNDGTLGILLKTNSANCHILYNGQNGGDARIDFYEATVTTDDGTQQTPISRNRVTEFVTVVEAYIDPTIDSLGTPLDSLILPGGTGPQADGSGGAVLLDWSLRPNTNYYLQLTNISGQAQPAHLHIDFYEDL